MTTHLSKNELSYDIDFGTDDDCLEASQLYDEASEGIVKYYYDDIFNVSGDLPIPSTGITEFGKYMSSSETQRVYNNNVELYSSDASYYDKNDGYLYKITNSVKATHKDKIVGVAICLPHNNVNQIEFYTNHFSDEKKALSSRLVEIFDGVEEVVTTYRPDEVAIEETFVNVNPKSTLILGHARGVVMLVPARFSIKIALFSLKCSTVLYL